ncbi:Enoyl-acyl-carrier-protein reductase FabI [Candidatus Cyrtobacter comes]|uniref:Enoyl-[acyl-carrier-protein] reductase [NADH] n=1 Tax=Candidatus Cyrtobacter comes TaxID=675776 RepID=A0ABU5L8U8_9RICK|nr:enoyl-ACP reductase [Candidatus Cyrtobacter comes]MDZ5762544.1 Enoyl-acyl-carrier-protein reductase FabI [Candidatus Cyrtobacter comes]
MLLKGKKGLIMGVANDRSIASGIAIECSRAGADLAFSYQDERLRGRVEQIASECNSKFLIKCDVATQESIKLLFEELEKEWGGIDFVVHAVAFANKDELQGRYIDTSLDNFQLSLNISCYSFTSVARHASSMMKNGGSLLTLSYYGAEKYIPNYNVMGIAKAALEASVIYAAHDLGPDNIRVNAISAGPVRTLASSAISGIRDMLKLVENSSPLRRNVTISEIGKTAVYLLCDMSSGVTGEIIHVDSGYHCTGMNAPATGL